MVDRALYPPKCEVVGTGISMTSYDEVALTLRRTRSDRACVIAVCNVHSVMSARKDDVLGDALDSADIATPDGMPLVWAIRRLQGTDQERVCGPNLMGTVLAEGGSDLRHFFYGSSPSTLEALQASIRSQYPAATVAGSLSPPYRTLTNDEVESHLSQIRDSGATVVWVGLGMPKQELWMHQVAEYLPGVTLIGVGAAFDFIAGTVSRAPGWVQRTGFEWLYRLSQEPRRLWRRYAWNNPSFLILLLVQVLRSARAPWGTTS